MPSVKVCRPLVCGNLCSSISRTGLDSYDRKHEAIRGRNERVWKVHQITHSKWSSFFFSNETGRCYFGSMPKTGPQNSDLRLNWMRNLPRYPFAFDVFEATLPRVSVHHKGHPTLTTE